MTAPSQAKQSTIATKTPRAPSATPSRSNGTSTRYVAKEASMRRRLRDSVRFQLRVPKPMQVPTEADCPRRPASIRVWKAGPITTNTPRQHAAATIHRARPIGSNTKSGPVSVLLSSNERMRPITTATAAAANPSVAIAARPSMPDHCCPNKVNATDTVSVADVGMLLLVASGGGVCFGERCAVHSLPSQ